jgi:hypothetical protein
MGRKPQPWIHRALSGLFKRVGLEGITIEPYTEPTTLDGRLSAREQREWDVVGVARKAEQQELLSREETTAWLDEPDQAVRDGRFFMAVTYFLVGGRKR